MGKIGRRTLFSAAVGILTGLVCVAGYSLDNFQTLDLTQAAFYGKWAFWAAVSAAAAYGAFWGLDQLGRRGGVRSSLPGQGGGLSWLLHRPLCCFGLMLLCWTPALLSLFPGAFAYDANQEWQQVASGQLTAHHPVLHELFLGGLVEGVYSLTGSYETGIAVSTVLQMAALAAALTYTIGFLRDVWASERLALLALCFYCLSPVVQLFSISATKDVLFSAVELLFFLCVMRFCCGETSYFDRPGGWASLGVSALFSMLLRNNGPYIVIGTFLALALYCLLQNRRRLKALLAVLAAVAVSYGVFVGPVYGLLGVKPGGVEEMLSVPLQQMARVYRYDAASLEQEEVELLCSFVPKESLESYRATVSDFVKKDFNREVFAQRGKEFLRLWLKWGREHPLTYLNSFLINTVDAWYPFAVVDGYQDAYGKSSYFDYQVDAPGTEIVLLPHVHQYYEAISHSREVQKIPFVFLALSPGWYFLVWLIVSAYLWYRREYCYAVPMWILLLTFGTVLLGPIALVRYVLIFYFAFPVFMALVFGKRPKEGALLTKL